MIVGDRILLIHFRLGEAIYKYLYNKRTPEDRFKYGGQREYQKSILRAFC